MIVELYDEQQTLTDELTQMVQDVLAYAADYLELEENCAMSVIIVDNEEIQNINREYRQKDAVTDVISFALEESVVEDDFPAIQEVMDESRELGDIFVSFQRAQEQAVEYGHSFKRELGFLVVHGFLHLNGYDHMTDEEEAEMFDLQRDILDGFGLVR
ncbi:rRNA maturation RNase YbeY [Dolosigranulum pigrum]|jgi:metalloprotein, YbeY family|uniref:Endoribonuclease YbeY n=1 Tax=Dolosigranulum pigrum TaxID=29394 RepID=A0A1S8KM76_9LACT|nr:rRNA maturation RNase YbeY [Dolosigranulum pigrum]OOL80844.1 rRNA maturation RNase YbeY [Dolosigranulum pigrum]QTJ34595.1 rRNA maturation RNase YbeY [Dolosigranulum pigrum]QTJ39774.1 rRNA maturation RNase YbeY [Dolosigranulum pigrum]QTJ43205.1 rRNA maturation RNase YbeY [Dolosigranulum pigrum]QTJ44343.1 rRNA maturation RNase YbeY [Dolosigranulum pigrum]